MSGCSRVTSPPIPTPGPARNAPYTHRVKHGETLGQIAHWYTGDRENWRQLAEFNPDLKPKLLRPGQRVQIPKSILVTRTPLAAKAPKRRAHTVQSKQALPPETTKRAMLGTKPQDGGLSLEDEIVRDRLQDALLRSAER